MHMAIAGMKRERFREGPLFLSSQFPLRSFFANSLLKTLNVEIPPWHPHAKYMIVYIVYLAYFKYISKRNLNLYLILCRVIFHPSRFKTAMVQ